jgi:hypothetical protein
MTSDPYAAPQPLGAISPGGFTPAPSDFAASGARPPNPAECQACGFTPAAMTTFQRNSGFLLMSQHWTEKNVLCKGCATESFRRCQNWCLIRGWWGTISFFLNTIFLFANLNQMRKLRSMPRPSQRDPSVVAPRQAPHDGGAPLLLRPGALAFLAIVALVVVVAVLPSA